MRMPRTLRIGPRRYTITRDADTCRRYIDEHDLTPARPCELNGLHRAFQVAGLHMPFRRQFYIKARVGQAEGQETLLHEVLHALWVQAGLDATSRLGGYEEQVVSALTQPLLDVLQRNPALVRYITDKETS